MTEQEFYQLLHRRLSQIAIGPSAIRNQGAPGMVDILRRYCEAKIDLQVFVESLIDKEKYECFLDMHTLSILAAFPQTAKSWGAARKGLNLFLREIIYSKFFSDKFSMPHNFEEFNKLVRFMEVPLDKEVAYGVSADSKERLPTWKNIKNLTPKISEIFQNQALTIATMENVARVNLDLKYWRPYQPIFSIATF